MTKSGGRKPEETGLGAYPTYEGGVVPPNTAEDFLALLIKEASLDEIVVLLRDRYGRKEIKKALNKIEHRDPVDPLTNIRRHAVELYAIRHKITPSNLMLKLGGVSQRSEREKLENARNYVVEIKDALTAAQALAEKWEADRPKERDNIAHLKNNVKPKV
jgi:hypothetical protein